MDEKVKESEKKKKKKVYLFKQKTAYEIKECDWSSDVCSSDLCGKRLVIKWGRRGKFLSCSEYPRCKFSKSISTGKSCPEEGCGGELIERRSSKGMNFYGCSNFPKCHYTSNKLPE